MREDEDHIFEVIEVVEMRDIACEDEMEGRGFLEVTWKRLIGYFF